MKMKSKTMSNQKLEKPKKSRLKNRRAITDIISTMMLMGVTVTGASTLTYFVNDAFISGNLASASSFDSSKNILLLAYDTRDSSLLLSLLDVDNEYSGFLCGGMVAPFGTCNVAPSNSIPENGGTEFIVLQIQNRGLDSVFLEDIAINNVIHTWDSSTSGIELDASVDYLSGADRKYPADGMFSILPVGSSPIIQNENIQIQSGQIVNLLIKLGSDDSDIGLNKGVHIRLDMGGMHPVELFIETGDAR
jgi:hypothetical protein